jgi:RNA polymerase sigma-70 factor (ECF subfamily)
MDDLLPQQLEEPLQELDATIEKTLELDMVKDGLTQQEWMLLHKYYILGYSSTELSQMRDCSPSSIRMALSRARKKAKEILLRNRKNGGADNG